MLILRFLGRVLFTVAWTAMLAVVGVLLVPYVVAELPKQSWPVVVFWCVLGPLAIFGALSSIVSLIRWASTGRNGPRVRWKSTGGGW